MKDQNNNKAPPPPPKKSGQPPLILNFLPALLVWPCWLAIGFREEYFLVSFRNMYPLMIAMVFGSMIAGSTPLGGGVVAFPVAVLAIGFKPHEGRDFSLFIQSIGMTAAAFLIFTRKAHLLAGCGSLLASSCFFSIIGMVIGFELKISPFIVNIVYTTTVAAFAILLAYVNWFDSKKQDATAEAALANHAEHDDHNGSSSKRHIEPANSEARKSSKSHAKTNTTGAISGEGDDEDDVSVAGQDVPEDLSHMNKPMDVRTWIGVTLSGLIGGFLTSQIGSGADITWFVLGSIFLNTRRAKKDQFSGNALTAVSVIIMATASVFGTILRISTTGEKAPTQRPFQAWMACVWIVVVGAPLGSLFLTPALQETLKRLFYVCAFVQLIIFGILKIKNNGKAWGGVVGTLGGTVILIAFHYMAIAKKRLEEAEQKSAEEAAAAAAQARSVAHRPALVESDASADGTEMEC